MDVMKLTGTETMRFSLGAYCVVFISRVSNVNCQEYMGGNTVEGSQTVPKQRTLYHCVPET
jgi:hypothetical protein